MHPPRTVRPLLQNLLLSLGSVAAFLLFAEGASRLVERGQPERPPPPYITDWASWDGDFYTVKSTAVGWPPWEGYNRDGLRDREHALGKPSGVRRVVCLGDSTTLGWRLRPEEAYPQVLQDRVSARGWNIEVFNVALGGWATRQELIAYRKIARAYRPDLVLLGICLNDFAEMQNNLTRPPAFLAALHQRSALVRRLVRAQDREIGSIEELFRETPSSKVENAFARVFSDLRTLHDEVRADGAQLALFVLPYRPQLEPGGPPATPQKRVAEFCAAEKIPCLDLLADLHGLAGTGFTDHVHLNSVGARRVAETVLESGLLGGDDVETLGRTAHMATGSEELVPGAGQAPELIAALRSGEPGKRAAAARALGSAGADVVPAVQALTATLDDPVADVRAAASWALGGLAPKESSVVHALGAHIHDENPLTRAGAAWALGRIGSGARSATGLLISALQDPDESVRWRAGDALGAVGCDRACVAPLIAILADTNGPGQPQAAEALGRLGPVAAPAVEPLVVALRQPREELRLRAAWALGEIGPEARPAVPALVAAMKDGAIRWRVVDALGGIGPAAHEAVPVLVEAARDESASVRWRAIKALTRVGPAARAAVPMLLEALRDSQDNVRVAAITALPKVDAPRETILPAYLKALSDSDSRVRHDAADGLGRLGPVADSAAEALAHALKDDDAGVRAACARALGRIGATPALAANALAQALTDDDPGVRAEAQRALGKLSVR